MELGNQPSRCERGTQAAGHGLDTRASVRGHEKVALAQLS